jgi:hypothetical protein
VTARTVRLLLLGGLVVGAIDALDAVVFFGLRNGIGPARIFQSIAAGLLGRDAFRGGPGVVALGVALHFTIALLIVITCYVVSGVLRILIDRPWMCGPVFGIGAYCVMNYVVIPLSATRGGAFVWPVFLNGIGIHMIGIGIPSALFARAARTPR